MENENNLEITITDDEFQKLVIGEQYHALRKNNYFIGETHSLIKRHLTSLRNDTLFVLIFDIKDYFKRGGGYTWQSDKNEWLNLLSILEDEYERRKIARNKVP